MFDVPDSSAMDATAPCGGPGALLAEIAAGSPEQLGEHSAALRAKAAEFTALLDEFVRASEQLVTLSLDLGSVGTVRRIAESRSAFSAVVTGIESEAELIGASAAVVRDVRAAYVGVVRAVNPTVAALLANRWSHGAAVALSTAASAALRAFVAAAEDTLRGQWHG